MGRAGFVAGNIHSTNHQAGSITTTLGGTGTDTTSVVFAKKMNRAPKVVVTSTANKVYSSLYVSAKTNSGFTLNMVTSTLTGAASFDYVAYDDSYR